MDLALELIKRLVHKISQNQICSYQPCPLKQTTLTYRECNISHGQGRTFDLYIYIHIVIYIYSYIYIVIYNIYIPLSGMIENDTQMVS